MEFKLYSDVIYLMEELEHILTFLSFAFQDLENQMHIAEQRRRTLLKDFHDTSD